MTELDQLWTWFEEHYPGEFGWSIQTSVSPDRDIRVCIQNCGQVRMQYDAKANPTDTLFERLEQAIQNALEQLVDAPLENNDSILGHSHTPFTH